MVNLAELYIQKIQIGQTCLIDSFLKNAGDSLKFFRYFNKRPVSAIAGHLVTCLLIDHEKPVGYGHLDLENEIVWLGIAVIDSGKRKGYGKIIMSFLIDFASKSQINEINLSVDKNNHAAIQLYTFFEFEIVSELNEFSILMKKKMGNEG
jgi:ribosomal protein S18 acetylase RimI-like enzyme